MDTIPNGFHPERTQSRISIYIVSKQVSKQTSLFLTQLQLQQNELKLEIQNAQNREKKYKVSHQINPVAEACKETAKGP